MYVRRGYVCMNVSSCRSQMCEIPLELGLKTVVSHLMWVLGIELRTSGRAVCALNH